MYCAYPANHHILILSTDLRKGHVNSSREVSDFLAGVTYDGTVLSEFPTISKGRQHDAANYVAALDPPSIVKYG